MSANDVVKRMDNYKGYEVKYSTCKDLYYVSNYL